MHAVRSADFLIIQTKNRETSFHERFIRAPSSRRRRLMISRWVRKGTDTRRGDIVMTLHHAACTAAPLSRRISLPACPQCGDMLLAPLLAEHVSAQHVRTHWA